LEKVVHKIVITKEEVIAFFNDRREFEIIYIKKGSDLGSYLKTMNNVGPGSEMSMQNSVKTEVLPDKLPNRVLAGWI